MIFSRRAVLVFFFLISAALAAAATRAKSAPATPDAATAYKGAIVLDATSGKVLFEDRADYSGPPASMTKLMTFAVLHDEIRAGRLHLATPVTVTAADSKIGGTQVWLKEKEVFPVEELLYAMMIQSANDAAFALARAAGGSVAAFVESMNAKAQQLGMTHTTFRTPHGLPPSTRQLADGDLTTPRDFALLCRHLLLKTDVLKYTAVKARDFGAPVRSEVVKMTNHDHLLGRLDGVDGLKTGYTKGAGFCLSTTALRKGQRVIVVTMGGPDSKTRDLKVVELVERGFKLLPAGGPAFASLLETPPISAAPSPSPAVKPAAPADDAPLLKVNLPPARKTK
ncbi:MAG: hypothetical protein RLZZ15_1995 [Verrucomicrobiota bacterium]|jgi:D-alanyl-D-alanine carboxypeptidase (penicillin-binding protein 5/6)